MLAVGVAILALTGPMAAPDDQARLERARARWSRQHLLDYRYRLSVVCFCPPKGGRPRTLTVRRGRPVRPGRYTASYDTVPELFGVVEEALEDRVDRLTVRYDRRRGFPRTIAVDRRRNATDDELTITVDRLRPLR